MSIIIQLINHTLVIILVILVQHEFKWHKALFIPGLDYWIVHDKIQIGLILFIEKGNFV